MNEVIERFDKYGMEKTSCGVPVGSAAADFRLGDVSIAKADIAWIGHTISDAFNASNMVGEPISGASITRLISQFYDAYLPSVPSDMRGFRGSTSDDGLLCNWLLLHAVHPDCYVESGVFIGSSLRLADAALPKARKWAYDLSFEPLLYRSEEVAYIANEWSEEPPALGESKRIFAFFDDHIDPVKRIRECHSLGIEWVLFDDSPLFSNLNRYRYPAIPTIPMILDHNMPDGAIVEWKPPVGQDQLIRYTHDKKYCQTAKDLIFANINMGDLFSKVGLSCGDKMVVRLKGK